jgi:processive 1,2-diacylglycerol beta-glucosyltransferase
MGCMPRVLILTASYGSGHNTAAGALAAAFRRAGAHALVVDHFRTLVHPLFARATEALYAWMLRRAPMAWGLAYGLGDRLPSDSPLAFGATRLGATRLARLLADTAPDLVVSVHATPAVAMATLARRGVRIPPHITVVTDFVAHSQWIAPGVDRYCVAATEVKHDFVARGIAPGRVVVTGVPVREEFAQRVDRRDARRGFGLPADGSVVLAMAGAHGSFGRLPEAARALGALPSDVHGVVVAGLDPCVEAAVRSVAGPRLRVFGHVSRMRALMAAADVLVTKAGGMTLAEALAAELPMVTWGSLPGQERRNERFASRSGIALMARTPAELQQALQRALGQPGLLERLRGQIARLRRPDATRRVVAVALERTVAGP